jgi:ribosomal subunit interface protein
MYTSTQIEPSPFYFDGLEPESAIPVEIQFRHMPESKKVIWLVQQMMEKFEKYPLFGAKVTVVVDETHHRRRKGIFQVKVRLSVPGERLYVAQSAERTGMHDGVYAAIAEVFEKLERQLVKTHDRRAHRRAKKVYEYVYAA